MNNSDNSEKSIYKLKMTQYKPNHRLKVYLAKGLLPANHDTHNSNSELHG